MVEFRDKLGYRFREPVWVKGALNREKLEGRYKKMPASLPSITIMPAFNPLIGGMCLGRLVDLKRAKL
ncbi:MAG: hypothetical protein ACYTEL_27280 [Planctomycetota bacterium]